MFTPMPARVAHALAALVASAAPARFGANAPLSLGLCFAIACSSSSRPRAATETGPGATDASAGDAADAAAADDAAGGGGGVEAAAEDAGSASETGASFVATALAMGAHHTCALTAQGGVRCWGDNTYGQLGDGTTIARLVSVGVAGLTAGVTAIAAGANHTCALTALGPVFCWGDNASGALGTGQTAAQESTPAAVSGLTSGVTAIAAGGADTCAAIGDGGTVCWGDNVAGQLGDGTHQDQPTPVPTLGAGAVAAGPGAMAPAGDHTCIIAADGSVVCAGDDTNGALGNGENASTDTFVASGISDSAIAVASSLGVTCVLTSDGVVSCWGFGGDGELGNGSMDATNSPAPVIGLSGGTALAAGAGHACAVTAGATACWGNNAGGDIGDGTTTARPTPTPVSGLTNAAAVAAGAGTCALTTSGAVLCWGPNTAGEVGDGTASERDAPTAVIGFP